MTAYRRTQRGFTLVEILIVVIILGILAAIVIPQFTNASTDAREASVRNLLQTIRSQIELYKLQHGDLYPTDDGLATGDWDWTKLTGKTDVDGTANAAGAFGPYMQNTPTNPLNTNQTVAAAAADGVGWVFTAATGKMSATDATELAIFAE